MTITIRDLQAWKAEGKRFAMLTAYDYPTAKVFDEAGIPVLLVGDSVGNTILGYENTLPVTMDEMLHHTRAVARGVTNALVVGDMPFLSYQAGEKEAVVNAGRFLAEGGCSAVKVEGGRRVLSAVSAILAADIPVMGHVGLTPQSYRKLGGFKVQGREADSARQIREDAQALAEAGCFAIVLECVPEALAAEITQEIPIPTLGIGAGPHCDGQVLVFHDVVGLTRNLRPKFVRRYADLSAVIGEAARAFAKDVKSGNFPSQEESFGGAKATALRRVH